MSGSAVVGYRVGMTPTDAAARAASRAGGQILRAVTGLVAARPAAKPLHPRGSTTLGTLHRFGADVRTGAEY